MTKITDPLSQVTQFEYDIASLLPKIEGEEIDRLLLASGIDGPSGLRVVTKSGKEYPGEEILGKERLAML